jgi:hypothetical protein
VRAKSWFGVVMDSADSPEQPERDYSYDAAHDDLPFGQPLATPGPAQPVTVATETDDDNGDYSYDLAHDIPRSGA